MRIVGFIALILLGIVVLALVALLVASVPDINRYRRVRKM
jgi:Tfp pilus assembly protein PilV